MWHAAPGQHNAKPFSLATTRIEHDCRQSTSAGSGIVTCAACSEDGSAVACVYGDGVLTFRSNSSVDIMASVHMGRASLLILHVQVVSMLSECSPDGQTSRCAETKPIDVQIVETDEASSALVVHFQSGDLFQWLPDDKFDESVACSFTPCLIHFQQKCTWCTRAYRTPLHSFAIGWSQSRTMVAALSEDRGRIHLMAVGASNEDESNEREQLPVSLLPICVALEAHPSSSGSGETVTC